jgi:hypothetical protein
MLKNIHLEGKPAALFKIQFRICDKAKLFILNLDVNCGDNFNILFK